MRSSLSHRERPSIRCLVLPLALVAVVGSLQPVFAAECDANPDWFSGVPSIPEEVNEGDPQGRNCGFHKFSWQAFLALVSGSPPSFLSWMPARGIFVADGMNPTAWGADPPVPTECTGDAKFVLHQAHRTHNPDAPQPEAVLQATGDPLTDQRGRWVHYGIQVNEKQYDRLVDCNFYRQQCFQKHRRPDAESRKLTFPNGSVEIKNAWRVMETCDLPDSPEDCEPDDLSRYFTVKAQVQPYGPPYVAAVCRQVTVGLIGFHIVAKTPEHQEWVWASFEHLDNAPQCENPSQAPSTGWSLNDPDCASNCDENEYVDPCTGGSGFDKGCAKPPIPTQVCENQPHGGSDPFSGNTPEIVVALNKSAWSNLPQDSVWRHYELIGTEWQAGGLGGRIVGSINLANSSMETFVLRAPGGRSDDCFSCHRQNSSGRGRADFSHVFFRLFKPSEVECPALPDSCFKAAE